MITCPRSLVEHHTNMVDFTFPSDSDERAIIALYHNTICTDAHSKQQLWGDIDINAMLHILGRPLPRPIHSLRH